MNKITVYEPIKELLSIQDVLRWVACRFSVANIYYGHGADNPWDEALQLVLPSIHLPINTPKEIYSARLTLKERYCISVRVIRRINERIPSAYLTNRAWFCGHEFYVDERVLIPRSPIGELISNRFSGLFKENPHRILDMCTGSGCIAIACAYAFPEAKIDAVDISIDALAVTKYNIEEHGLNQHITPILSDLFQNLPKTQYNLIIANPPYVSNEDIFSLPDEYQYEPKLGLISGNDGLDLINRIISFVSDFLEKDGILICEVGDSMMRLIKRYPNLPFTWLKFTNGGDGVFMLTKTQLDTRT